MPLISGTRLGRFEVRSLLGAGGMGEVYRAWDHDLERDVAIKVLHEGSAEDGDRVRRFVQEAKAASGLHHPNVGHVYEIGSHDGLRFIAMELVEGETLFDRMDRGPLPLSEVIELGLQIAAALAAAHRNGIVHRDIKPANVMVTPDGYAKVLDFGLAKLREIRSDDASTIFRTAPGVAMGTLGYMAPEQLLGADVHAAADVFSLGVVLYEMIAGQRPFTGSSTSEIVSAILTKAPRSLTDVRRDVPPKLEAVIAKSLAKDPDARYRDAGELHEQLREISRGQAVVVPPPQTARSARVLPIVLAIVIVGVLAGAGWMFVRSSREREALARVETAETLVKERKLAEAYEMAMTAMPLLPDNERLREVITQTSARLTIESEPAGATVYLQRLNGAAQRVPMGITPLTIPRLPRAHYLLTLEKVGFAPGVRPISNMPVYLRGEAFVRPETFRMKLAEAAAVPAGMVFVEGGSYRLAGFTRPSDRIVELRDFYIDRHEVSNREFEQFIREGGYRRRELWKIPFVDGGKTLSFEQAMARFRDTTGVPAPRSWSGGAPPSGRENHPVTDVTWYEAAAFAEWKGKNLPTIYQWERAGRYPISAVGTSLPWGMVSEGVDVTERSNFLGKGTMAVDTMPFGVSIYGAHHMAGNVSEWCRNPHAPGRAARGGAWNDAIYAFGQTAAYPPFYSAPTLGFRCAVGGGGDEGDFALDPKGFVPEYKPVDDATFEQFRRRYDYQRGPLKAQVVARSETPDWTLEKIHYQVSGKTVPAYLYLPKGFRRPLQVIYFAPAGDVVSGLRTLPHSMEVQLAPFIRTGRAVFAVEFEGYLGRPRPADWVRPEPAQEEYVDYNVGRVTEMRRGLDYLETREEIDASRIALFGISAGGGSGVFATALESRFRSVAFAGTGIQSRESGYAPAASRINFVSRIKAPKLMIHGVYDEDTSLQSEAEPMFRLLSEPKRLDLYDGAHMPPLEVMIPTVTKWLDDTMGPVEP